MIPPVVSLVGRPDCGKTTLLEKLIPELSGRGYRIGTVKHHVHEFDMDKPGKDTWRHKKAGAHTVVLSSPSGIGIIRDTDHDCGLDELAARYFGEVDLLIAEGYKQAQFPKIEVFRREAQPEPLAERDHTWIGFVGDPAEARGLPCFAADQVAAIADFLIDRFLFAPPTGPEISLTVNGQPVPLNRFVADFLRQSVMGMVSSLRGCAKTRQLTITIDNPGPDPSDEA